MQFGLTPLYALTFMVAVLSSGLAGAHSADPLPSWNDGWANIPHFWRSLS